MAFEVISPFLLTLNAVFSEKSFPNSVASCKLQLDVRTVQCFFRLLNPDWFIPILGPPTVYKDNILCVSNYYTFSLEKTNGHANGPVVIVVVCTSAVRVQSARGHCSVNR